jgi:hypothetical protein
MKAIRAFGFLVELVMFAASLSTGGGNVAEGIRAIAVLVAAVVGGLVIFCAVVLTVAVCGQRQPPYDFGASDG